MSLSPSSGFSTQYGNFGEMENKGYEIDLAWNAIQKADLSLNASLNWARNVNEVTDLYGTEVVTGLGASVQSIARVGYPLGTQRSRKMMTVAMIWMKRFPQITSSFTVLGDQPRLACWSGINLNYKKFGLNVVVEHSQGGEFHLEHSTFLIDLVLQLQHQIEKL